MVVTHTAGIYGLSESEIRQRLQPLTIPYELVDNDGEFQLIFSAEDAREVTHKLRELLNVYLYGVDVSSLQARVVQLLAAKGFTLATAESCTGGMLSGLLTAVPGASSVFECGVTAYSAAIKHELIGVSADTIRQHGTIAAQTAAEMAAGVRRVGHATLGIGITGSAGPAASEGHPPGTVFVALADDKRVWGKLIQVDGQTLGRDKVRRLAVLQALDLARRYLEAWPNVMAGGEALCPIEDEPVAPPQAPVKERSWKERLLPNVEKGRAANFRLLTMWALTVLGVLAAVWLLILYLF